MTKSDPMNSGTISLTARRSDSTPSRSYFPQSGASHALQYRVRPLPPRSGLASPVFDLEHAQDPLPSFDAIKHNLNYPELTAEGITVTPHAPVDFDRESYLVPSLSREERLRLTVLWYYTRQVEQDEAFLSIIDRIIAKVQDAIRWESSIVGILDEASYTGLANANMPIGVLPRRESICSHTINQPVRTVFMSTDLAGDWRFQGAPHIKIGGMRSYAGTQVLLVTHDGKELALGSLCVISKSQEQPLSEEQRALLIKFADTISWELTERTRQLRSKERMAMTETLLRLQSHVEHVGLENMVIEALKQHYPGGHVTMQDPVSGVLELSSRSRVSLSDLDSNLWEDVPYIESAIRTANYERLSATHPVRMAAARCGASGRYIVVTFNDVQHVLDDLDSWFVERCAALAAEALQNRILKQALDAKEAFLRNVTHQLRTPIHGILGSLDLLAEELESLQALKTSKEPVSISLQSSFSSYITAIRSSGRELMTTVNNILRFNSLTTQQHIEYAFTNHDLRALGQEIISDALQIVPEDLLLTVSIQTELKLSFEQSTVETNGRWLKECLQPLLLNGLQSVMGNRCGLVTMVITYDALTGTLCFDFKDTGIGIKKADQGRIFSAFEKVNAYKSGLGLGLTLSRTIAERYNGSISLIASLEGYGSHFRASFSGLKVLAPAGSLPDIISLPHMPYHYHKLHCSLEHSYMLHHMGQRLGRYGFETCDHTAVALIITDMQPHTRDFDRLCTDRKTRSIIITVIPNFIGERIQSPNQYTTAIVVTGPFYDERLDYIFRQADMLYAELIEPTPIPVPTTSPTEDRLEPSHRPGLPPHINPSAQVSPLQVTPTKRPTSPSKALLVDDNVINLRILEMFCRKRKIPYILACDGLKAEEEFRKAMQEPQPVDLIFMDLQMPIRNGTQATRGIRQIEEEAKLSRSAIFIITGQDSPNDKLQSEQAGADEFLVKPVSLKVLDEHVTKYFSEYMKKS